jgi:formate dehydrogenase maturation protein FdhE
MVIPMKIKHSRHSAIKASTKPIMAADEEFDISEEEELDDTIDDVQDSVDDLQEAVDDVVEDDIEIEMDNNIADHFIAECDSCGGIFISALIESDQEVESISGVCPICGKDTMQNLKWIVRAV